MNLIYFVLFQSEIQMVCNENLTYLHSLLDPSQLSQTEKPGKRTIRRIRGESLHEHNKHQDLTRSHFFAGLRGKWNKLNSCVKESILLASEYSNNVTNMETIRTEIESVLETQFTTAKALKVNHNTSNSVFLN